MKMEEIISLLKKSDAILVTSHVNPDGDAIGALLAMGLALKGLNKRVTLYNESPIPAVYRFLPAVETVVSEISAGRRFDAAVVLDCGDITRIGERCALLEDIPQVVNIDHHLTNTGFGHHRIIDTEACASTEIVFRLLKRMEIPIDSDIATSIYTGILTDTGSFRFANTNAAAFDICGEMVQRGVIPHEVARHVYGTYSLGRIKLLNMALDSLEISFNGKLSLMTLTRDMFEETGTQLEDVDGLINYAKRIEDIRLAALIVETRNGPSGSARGDVRHYHVSLRSDGSVDVAAIAASYGGGGHATAAGFGIEASLADLKSRIIDWSKGL
jgi:phosphoesterase RecJ-like protein